MLYANYPGGLAERIGTSPNNNSSRISTIKAKIARTDFACVFRRAVDNKVDAGLSRAGSLVMSSMQLRFCIDAPSRVR